MLLRKINKEPSIGVSVEFDYWMNSPIDNLLKNDDNRDLEVINVDEDGNPLEDEDRNPLANGNPSNNDGPTVRNEQYWMDWWFDIPDGRYDEDGNPLDNEDGNPLDNGKPPNGNEPTANDPTTQQPTE